MAISKKMKAMKSESEKKWRNGEEESEERNEERKYVKA